MSNTQSSSFGQSAIPVANPQKADLRQALLDIDSETVNLFEALEDGRDQDASFFAVEVKRAVKRAMVLAKEMGL